MNLEGINKGKAILKSYSDHDGLIVRADGLYTGCNIRPDQINAEDLAALAECGYVFDDYWNTWKAI
jgi:hypothetical protein